MNLRKDHYRIDRVVFASSRGDDRGNDSRSSLERARRRTRCIRTAAVNGVAPRKGATAVDSRFHERFWRSRITGVGVRVPFPSTAAAVVRSAGPPRVRRRPRLLRRVDGGRARRSRTGRARADGERRWHRVCRRRRTPSPAARFKESLELVSTAQDRAGARPAADDNSAARRAAARASFFCYRSLFITRTGTFL